MSEKNLALELRDNAKHQIQQIKDIETGRDYLNKVKTIETWAKAEKMDAELQNTIAENKIRVQRILGELLKQNEVSNQGFNNVNMPNKENRQESSNSTPKNAVAHHTLKGNINFAGERSNAA